MSTKKGSRFTCRIYEYIRPVGGHTIRIRFHHAVRYSFRAMRGGWRGLRKCRMEQKENDIFIVDKPRQTIKANGLSGEGAFQEGWSIPRW